MKAKLLEQLRKNPVVEIACHAAGVGRTTYYRWRKEDSEFAKQSDLAIAEGRLFVNDIAESQLISAIRDKNMTGIIFWLRNNHPTYANRLEVTGKLETREELTSEQEAAVREALRLASLVTEEHISKLNRLQNHDQPHYNNAGENRGPDTEGPESAD